MISHSYYIFVQIITRVIVRFNRLIDTITAHESFEIEQSSPLMSLSATVSWGINSPRYVVNTYVRRVEKQMLMTAHDLIKKNSIVLLRHVLVNVCGK